MHFTCILWNFYLLEILLPLLNIAFCQMAIPNKEQGLDKGVVFSVAPLNDANEIPSIAIHIFTGPGIDLDSVYRDENCLCRVPNCATKEELNLLLWSIFIKL